MADVQGLGQQRAFVNVSFFSHPMTAVKPSVKTKQTKKKNSFASVPSFILSTHSFGKTNKNIERNRFSVKYSLHVGKSENINTLKVEEQ